MSCQCTKKKRGKATLFFTFSQSFFLACYSCACANSHNNRMKSENRLNSNFPLNLVKSERERKFVCSGVVAVAAAKTTKKRTAHTTQLSAPKKPNIYLVFFSFLENRQIVLCRRKRGTAGK